MGRNWNVRAGVVAASVGLAMSVPAGVAWGQYGPGNQPAQKPAAPKPKEKPKPAAPAVQPGQQAQQAARRADPKLGPYVQRGQWQDQLVRFKVRLLPERRYKVFIAPSGLTKEREPVLYTESGEMSVQSVTFVFPYVMSTASGELLGKTTAWPQGQDTADQTYGYRGRFFADEHVVDDLPEIIGGYPYGTRLGKWTLALEKEVTIRQFGLTVELPVRCYDVEFDESAAMEVVWPKLWPREALDSLRKDQFYVETGVNDKGEVEAYPTAGIEAALAAYLKEEGLPDAKAMNPVRVAKIIAGKVWRDVQPTASGAKYRIGTSQLSGFAIQPPSVTLASGRGSQFDIAALMAALYRQSGLPARTVLGMDRRSGDDNALSRNREKDKLTAWVEFCLYDEERNTVNWVPVDVVRARKNGSRPPDIEKPWKYFGTCENFKYVAPFATTFMPPTDVALYEAVGFWGWFVTPKVPYHGEALLDFDGQSMPNRPGTELMPVSAAPPEEAVAPEVKPAAPAQPSARQPAKPTKQPAKSN